MQAKSSDEKAHQLQQRIKWAVYALLLINFGFYIYDDWVAAAHILTGESSWLDWARAFATSIDESAWFLLLLMFELETYALDDKHWTPWVGHAVRGVRLVCFVLIAHTIFAYANTVRDYRPTVPIAGVTSLCELTNSDFSYVYNLKYTAITADNCNSLSSADEYYPVGKEAIVSDFAGLKLERKLARVDLMEAIAWVIAILAIEAVVRLQGRGVTSGPLVTTLSRSKLLLYALIVGFGIYWASLSHWLYLWDELVWIAGFAVIDMNVSDWRKEILSTISVGDAGVRP